MLIGFEPARLQSVIANQSAYEQDSLTAKLSITLTTKVVKNPITITAGKNTKNILCGNFEDDRHGIRFLQTNNSLNNLNPSHGVESRLAAKLR